MEWKQSAPRLPGRNLGIASITGAVLLLSLSDALVKGVSDRLGLGQIVFLRSLVAVLLLVAGAALFSRVVRLRTVRTTWVIARSLCLAAMWLCYYAALPSMSFALAAACYYTAPAWMALLSRLILREAVGIVRWLAVILATAGVVVALAPAEGRLSPVVGLPLAAAFFYALAAIITWSRCRHEAPLAMALNLNLVLAACGATGIAILAVHGAGMEDSFILAVWPAMTPADWLLIAGLGLLLAVITSAVAQAYALAPAPVIGVFDNAYLLFAAFWSAVAFGDLPTAREAVGMALIACGAVLATR